MVLPDGEMVWLGTTPDGGEEVDGYDLRGAVIGSEGMFGIVTRVLVRLDARAAGLQDHARRFRNASTTRARPSATSSRRASFPARWR